MADEPPKRWPLVTNPGNRFAAPTQDGRLVNCFAELDPQYNEWDIIRRFGVRPHPAFDSSFDNLGKGIFSWSPSFGTNYIMQVRSDGATAGIYRNTTFLDNVQDLVYDAFEPVQSSTPTLFFKAGGFGYTTDGTTVTAISDANWLTFDQDLLPGAASLNGRLYVLAAPNRVYGATNLNDGTAWSLLNLILANSDPDNGTYIVRYLEYILVMKELSTEVFRDEGNSTGSPLGKVPGVNIPYGCLFYRTVVRINDDLMWVATSRNSSNLQTIRQLVQMQGLSTQVVSTPQVDRLLTIYTPIAAYPMFRSAHKLYCVELFTGFDYITLVYDLTSQLWYEWYMPTRISFSSGGPFGEILQATDGQPLQPVTNASFDQTEIAGALIPIPMDIYTPNMDFGVDWQKTLWSLSFTGDQTAGTILKIRRSDDDYQTWSNFRQVDLSKKKPRISDEGAFYRRAYHLRFDQAGPIRLRSMGMLLELGDM